VIDGALVALDRVVLLIVLLDLFEETVLAAIGFHGVQMSYERLVLPVTAIVFHFGFNFIYTHDDSLHVALNFRVFSNFVDVVSTAFLGFRKRMIFDVLFELLIFAEVFPGDIPVLVSASDFFVFLILFEFQLDQDSTIFSEDGFEFRDFGGGLDDVLNESSYAVLELREVRVMLDWQGILIRVFSVKNRVNSEDALRTCLVTPDVLLEFVQRRLY
jgi:hypothetical protein